MDMPDLFREAINEARAGNRERSRELLQVFLQDEPRHELAWLWLSKVSATRADKIAALEKALAINPTRETTAVSLAKLKQQTPQSQPAQLDEWYRQAYAAYRDGRSLRARLLLHQIVETNQKYAKAWFSLGQIEPKLEDRLFALTVALHLHPANPKAQTRLAQMEGDGSLNHFTLAQRFETFGLTETAVTYYQKAQQHACRANIRQAAKEKQQQLQQKAQQILVDTTPIANLIRLAAGPTILYLLLIVIVSGINPLNISLPLFTGGVVVALGSLLITTAHYLPQHSIWRQLLGSNGLESTSQQYLITGIGVALLLMPFALVFLSNATEFMLYYATHPINLSN